MGLLHPELRELLQTAKTPLEMPEEVSFEEATTLPVLTGNEAHLDERTSRVVCAETVDFLINNGFDTPQPPEAA